LLKLGHYRQDEKGKTPQSDIVSAWMKIETKAIDFLFHKKEHHIVYTAIVPKLINS